MVRTGGPPYRRDMTLPRRTAAAAFSTLLLLGFAACGSDESDGGEQAADPTSASTPAGDATDEPTEDATEETTEPAEAPAGGAVLTDPPEGEPAATLTLDDTGFDQDAVTVPVGGVVRVTSTDGGPHGVIVADLDGASVMGGLDEWFRFDQPGSYPVSDEITGATATVVVE